MRNPNGYGSVFKLSGKRRNPFGVRITVGWEEFNGGVKQKYKNIGYYPSRQEAMIALAEYNKDPYDLDAQKITFAEVYEKWSIEKFKDMQKKNQNAYNMAFRLAEPLHSMKFNSVRKPHMQAVIDNCEKGHSTKKKIKVLFNQLYQFGLENDILEKDYSKFVEVPANEEETSREPFTSEDIKFLWDNVHKHDFIDTVLIMIYTGLRPGELITIENKNINLEERYMRGGIKTKAGINRIIPINKKILPLIENRMTEKKYLILNSKGSQMQYATFRKDRWVPLMKELEMDHRPHDCRHTFATLMDNADANKLSVQKIMGHSSQGITDQVYTHKNIEELVKAVDLI